MDNSSEICIKPEQSFQLSSDRATHSSHTLDYSPELLFHPEQPPMEFIDNALECWSPTNSSSTCIGHDHLATSGYRASSNKPTYITLPMDLLYQETSPTVEDRKDGIFENSDNHGYDTVKRENETRAMTHSRRSSRTSNRLTSDESGIDKRERNRKAASKCRKKQKLANNELQEKARIMGEQHSCLMAHKASLESEMINLKNQLLLHGGCDCEPISDYLMQAARKFVKGRE
ncbi:hypothetical protein F4677DRAFT_462111 [Hypoxylon crocopeplum]|nr:hypothetical protein F4677DRAFT_462111 [Hypoxylon crocopeplum]